MEIEILEIMAKKINPFIEVETIDGEIVFTKNGEVLTEYDPEIPLDFVALNIEQALGGL